MTNLPSLEYLGGLFDGSAQLGIQKSSERQPQRLTFRIGRAERYVPDLFCLRFGGSVRSEKHGATRIFRWEASGRRAQEILRILLPFVHVKRADVERYCALQIASRGRRRGAITNPASLGNELLRVSA